MVYVECKPDEVLVKKLGILKKMLKHENDKGRVCKRLAKLMDCTGMVDEDPLSAQPSYLKYLPIIEEKHGVRVLSDKQKGNKVIILCPRLEEWIIKSVSESGFKMSDFGLPDKANELHRVINGRLQAFQKVIDKLIELENPGILFLKSHLT